MSISNYRQANGKQIEFYECVCLHSARVRACACAMDMNVCVYGYMIVR